MVAPAPAAGETVALRARGAAAVVAFAVEVRFLAGGFLAGVFFAAFGDAFLVGVRLVGALAAVFGVAERPDREELLAAETGTIVTTGTPRWR